MTRATSLSKLIVLTIALAVVLAATVPVSAGVVRTWTDANGANSNWKNVSNWSSSTRPSVDDRARFKNNVGNPVLNASYSIEQLNFDSAAAKNITIKASGTYYLTLYGNYNGDGRGIFVENTTNTTRYFPIEPRLHIQNNQEWDVKNSNHSGSDLIVKGNISDNTSKTITKTGDGTVKLNIVDKNIDGGWIIQEGTVWADGVELGNAGCDLTITGGTFTMNSAQTLDNVNVEGGTLSLSGGSANLAADALVLKSGTVTGGTGVLTSTANVDAQSGTIGAILGGAGGLGKTTVGTVTLSKVNTYTGDTTVSGGTLKLGIDNAIDELSDLIFNDGTTLETGGYDDTMATLDINGTVTFDFEGFGTSQLTFADSSGVTWGSTLNIINYTDGSDSIQFGADNTGLDAGQLSSITINGQSGITIDGSGFLVIPEPSTLALVVVGLLALLGCGRRRRR